MRVRSREYGHGMSQIQVLPATSERFDEVENALTGGGDGRACQCQWWMMPGSRFSALSVEEKTEILRAETAASVPPGLVATVDGVDAGWVRVGPRPDHERLARTKLYGKTSPEPWTDASTWAISCFSVRKEFRGQGLTRRLLDAAVAFARDNGARLVEAYPIDTAATKTSSNELYHGALTTFLDAGFVETARPRADRPIVALDLG
ncbi:GNAT superfamily N-acetyltransferase [Microbacterium sp. SORGH_AS428]|nr:GNAT superfamily N-acetyltransferase [Microbacterium sp. SORGH_AS_0428]